jgi:hypothetical protein
VKDDEDLTIVFILYAVVGLIVIGIIGVVVVALGASNLHSSLMVPPS